MNPNKAPGPDGYPGSFYMECWDIIGPSVIDTIQSFFLSGFMLKELNHTFIVLIPKNSHACEFKDDKPISLCNLVYKLISKILANRIRPILRRIIAPIQVAFVPGRWIHENGLIA